MSNPVRSARTIPQVPPAASGLRGAGGGAPLWICVNRVAIIQMSIYNSIRHPMAPIYKATVGIRFSQRMFRISSMTGVLADALLDLRGTKHFPEDHFTSIYREANDNLLKLSNESSGVSFTVDVENLTYTHDCYETGKKFDYAEFLAEIRIIWKVVNEALSIPPVRRIGFVVEHRFPVKEEPSHLLQGTLTPFKVDGFSGRFNLGFESRKPTGYGGLPDPKKDDFYNHIHSYYDSLLDANHPISEHFNANLDVQRYYSPAFKGDVIVEFENVKKEFDKASVSFLDELKKLGLIHAQD